MPTDNTALSASSDDDQDFSSSFSSEDKKSASITSSSSGFVMTETEKTETEKELVETDKKAGGRIRRDRRGINDINIHIYYVIS